MTKGEQIDHSAHYGGADNPYEAIKVIEAWGLGFNLGNAIKYITRAGKKGDRSEDLRKAKWYLEREIAILKAEHVSQVQAYVEMAKARLVEKADV